MIKNVILILLILPAACNAQINTKSEITLLSLNTWEGGTNVADGQIKILNAVLKSGADIIGISEATEGIGKMLADKLGWYSYVTNDNDIISRFPIKKSWNSLKGAGAEIEIENERRIVVKTVHLNYTPYGPYRACLENSPISQIIKEETSSGRMDEIKSALNSIKTYLINGTPVFLIGDLNVPSHLDWIELTANNHCGYIIQWPVSKMIEDYGMIDSYREAYRDPEAFPGITWSPIYKTYLYPDGKHEPLDRIDYIYYSGSGVKMLNSEIFVIGSPEQIPNHGQNEWPSDHSAVVSSFSVETNAKVNALPVAKFYASAPVLLQGQNVSFADISTNQPVKRSWFFEGGNPATSSEKYPVINYEAAGQYSVTLVSTNTEGSDTTIVTGLISVKSIH